MSTIVINCKNSLLSDQAKQLSKELGYPMLNSALNLEVKQEMFEYELILDELGISLSPTNASSTVQSVVTLAAPPILTVAIMVVGAGRPLQRL